MSQKSKVYDDYDAEKAVVESRKETSTSINTDAIEEITSSSTFPNSYATKKTISHGFTIGALLACNASQIKILLDEEYTSIRDLKWLIPFALVSSSIVVQLVLIILLGLVGSANLVDRGRRNYLNLINVVSLTLSLIVLAINIVSNVLIHLDLAAMKSNTGGGASSFWSTQSVSTLNQLF